MRHSPLSPAQFVSTRPTLLSFSNRRWGKIGKLSTIEQVTIPEWRFAALTTYETRRLAGIYAHFRRSSSKLEGECRGILEFNPGSEICG